MRYDIKVDSGSLHVGVGHLGDMGFVPQKKDFFVVGDFGKILFRRNDAGAITGFEISTGRVLALKFRKLPS